MKKLSQVTTFDSDDLGIYHYARTVPPLAPYHVGLDTLGEALADIGGQMPVHYPPIPLWTPDVEIQEAKNGHLYSGMKKGRAKGEKKMTDGFLLLDGKSF